MPSSWLHTHCPTINHLFLKRRQKIFSYAYTILCGHFVAIFLFHFFFLKKNCPSIESVACQGFSYNDAKREWRLVQWHVNKEWTWNSKVDIKTSHFPFKKKLRFLHWLLRFHIFPPVEVSHFVLFLFLCVRNKLYGSPYVCLFSEWVECVRQKSRTRNCHWLLTIISIHYVLCTHSLLQCA